MFCVLIHIHANVHVHVIGVGTGWSGGAIAPPLLEGNGDLKGVAYFSISLSPYSASTLNFVPTPVHLWQYM